STKWFGELVEIDVLQRVGDRGQEGDADGHEHDRSYEVAQTILLVVTGVGEQGDGGFEFAELAQDGRAEFVTVGRAEGRLYREVPTHRIVTARRTVEQLRERSLFEHVDEVGSSHPS